MEPTNEMDLGVLDETIARVRSRLRQRVESPYAAEADTTFDNEPEHVAGWLRSAQEACLAGEYLGRRHEDPTVETIYVEMNRFEHNCDEWFVDAFACGPPAVAGAPTVISPEFDRIVGIFLGDARTPRLTLTGMERLQTVFDRYYGESQDAVAEDLATSLVRLSLFQLFARACAVAQTDRLHVAAAVHDEYFFAMWPTPSEVRNEGGPPARS